MVHEPPSISGGVVSIPGVWWLAAGAKRGLGGWLDEPLLLGQDELVRLGDVEPVFHPLVHDDDLAAAVEEISALDARGRRERPALRLVALSGAHGRCPWAPTVLRASSTRAATMR